MKPRTRIHSPCRWMLILATTLATTQGMTLAAERQGEIVRADVIIAGGSTAALAAAFSAAAAGAETALIEPTDWIGGQLTASGVPAVDEAWHRIVDPTSNSVVLDVARIARDPRNMTPGLRDILSRIGNPGRGWVSRFCFEPQHLLTEYLEPWERQLENLTVYRNTVVKQVETTPDGRAIASLVCIQRQPRQGVAANGYDRLPSTDIRNWYAFEDSARFTKRHLVFQGPGSVFIEATEWGEVLALSNGAFAVGLDNGVDEAPPGNDVRGQATVFGFVQQLSASPLADRAPPATAPRLGWGQYEGRDDAWQRVWTYRRIRGASDLPTTGDLCLQNWGYSVSLGHGGNDYPFGYLFLTKKDTIATRDDWYGGVDLKVMAAAERRAFAWHHWFKSQTPADIRSDRITLARHVLGTDHGLAKLPYVRDTRRSIGLDGFVLRINDLIGKRPNRTGMRFPDRVAIGCYPVDVHPLAGFAYPDHVTTHRDTYPFYIPFRALTHRDFDNLLVAGKTMAQDFMANSATRLHPIEWSTGTAAGVIAAWMVHHRADTRTALESIGEVQKLIRAQTPIDWTLPDAGVP